MIPASYFFKAANCREWERPELPEGVPEVEVEEGRRWLDRLLALFLAPRGEETGIERQCSPGRYSSQRG
ncbi:hypothetical protein LMIY3S_01385 [Labrys miyagiensis]